MVFEDFRTVPAATAAKHIDKLKAALQIVADEFRERDIDPNDETYNPEFPVEMTLTVGEGRTILAALKGA
jgi:hypothetical protein